MRWLVVLLLVAFGATQVFALLVPVGRPDTDLFYRYCRETYLRGCSRFDGAFFGPIHVSQARFPWHAGSPALVTAQPPDRLSRRFLIEERKINFGVCIIPYGYGNNDGAKGDMMFIPELNCMISNSMSFQLAYRIDSRLNRDPNYEGKRWRSAAGYAEVAVFSYSHGRLVFDIGRRRGLWGVAVDGHSLFYSASAMPIDGLFLRYELGSGLCAHVMMASLSPTGDKPPYGIDAITENRFLSAHALSICPFDWLDLTFEESVIYGGQGRFWEPRYLIPLLWYHAEQLNSDADDNTFWGLDVTIRPADKITGYLEFLLDDFQIDRKSAGDREPSEYGLVIGAAIFDLGHHPSHTEISYTRVTNWTYNQSLERNRYLHSNRPLGHPLGPDHELLRLSYGTAVYGKIAMELAFEVQRRGQGRINSPWTAPWINDPNYDEKFPSGVVEKTNSATLAATYQKGNRWQCKLTAGIADIKNVNNESGRNKVRWSIEYELIHVLPIVGWRLSDEKQ